MRETKLHFGAVGIIVALVVAYTYSFYPFLSDDSLISLRYSKRLLEGEGLTWTEGEKVEGYSNLSWVLLNAFLGWLGLDLVVSARVLGIVFTLISCISLISASRIQSKSHMGWLYALMLFGLCGTTAVWAIGGLEQPLVGAALAWAIIGLLKISSSTNPSLRDALIAAVSFGILCLTRPDGPLFVVCTAVALWLGWLLEKKKIRWDVLITVTMIPFLFFVSQTLFRYYYYNEWVANTALVKVNPSIHHALGGFWYALKGGVFLWPIWLSMLFCWFYLYKRRQKQVLAVLIIPYIGWLLYIIVIGGDIFPAYRHFTPLVIIGSLTIAYCGHAIFEPLAHRQKYIALTVIGILFMATQLFSPDIKRARTERWEFDCKDLAETIKVGFEGRDPLIAVTAAGCLPFWSEFRAVDMLGLNDYFLPRNPPADFGSGYLAHELGNGQYILDRNPDLIIYHIGEISTSFRSGRELAESPQFFERYFPVRIRAVSTPQADKVIWVNRYSKKVGINQSGQRTIIPGYFLSRGSEIPTELNENGKLVAVVNEGFPASVVLPNALAPETGYRVEILSDGVVRHEIHTSPAGELQVSFFADTQAKIEQIIIQPNDVWK